MGNTLIISDTQAPFHHRDALPFLEAVAKKISPTKVVHVGDECFTEDTFVMTSGGWKSIRDVTVNDKVLQVEAGGVASFVTPIRKIEKEYYGHLVYRQQENYSSLTTAGHNLVVIDKDGIWGKRRADDYHYLASVDAPMIDIETKYGLSFPAAVLKWEEPKPGHHPTAQLIPYFGQVYCVTVPSGMLIIRHEGMISVSGNCDLHAVARNYKPHPNAPSSGDEFEKAKAWLDELEKLFPRMTLCHSNHAARIFKAAAESSIPNQWLKMPSEAYDKPRWNWVSEVWLPWKHGQVCIYHGDRQKGALRYAKTLGDSVACGHHHSEFGITFHNSRHRIFFGMDVGCLVDKDSLALQYAKTCPLGQMLGCGAIINGWPTLFPMEVNKKNRWTRRLV